MSHFIFNPFPDLTSERLRLRRLRAEDSKALFALRSSDEVNKYIYREKPSSETIVLEFIGKVNQSIAANEVIYWAVTLSKMDVLIGTICLWNIEKTLLRAEIGFELLSEFHGKGIMTEALGCVLKYGFTNLPLQIIEAWTHPANEASLSLLYKYGFIRDTQAEIRVAGDDELQDMIILSRSSDDYIKSSSKVTKV